MTSAALENVEAERAVLGACLKDPNVFWNEQGRFRPAIFADILNRDVAKGMVGLAEKGRTFDIPSLIGRVPERDGISIGGYLATLIGDQADNENAHDLIDDLQETWARREMVALGERLIKQATEASDISAQERLERAVARINAIGESISDEPGQLDKAVKRMLAEAGKSYQRQKSNGAPWFLREAARVTGDELEYGWHVGLLMFSGEGKTSFALQQGLFAAEQGVPFLFLSGDQTPEECIRQMVVQSLKMMEARDIRNGKINELEYEALTSEAERIGKLPIEIRKMGQPTTAQIGSTVRAWMRRYGPGLVSIDHIKRIRPNDPRANLDITVNQIGGDLKTLFQQTECIGLTLQQRNSRGFDRDNPRPSLADLYGGIGAAENFDTIMAGYVKENWLKERLETAKSKTEADKIREQIRLVEGKAELIGLKCRHGPKGRGVDIKREARFTSFSSFEAERLAAEPELLPE